MPLQEGHRPVQCLPTNAGDVCTGKAKGGGGFLTRTCGEFSNIEAVFNGGQRGGDRAPKVAEYVGCACAAICQHVTLIVGKSCPTLCSTGINSNEIFLFENSPPGRRRNTSLTSYLNR